MSLFPIDDKQRKNLPVFSMITKYFPKAMREVTRVCVANNVRYNPDKAPADINWARGKSPDQLGSAFRHMLEAQVDGLVFEPVPPEVRAATGFERVYVLAEGAWRLLAALELAIEEQESKGPAIGIRDNSQPVPADKIVVACGCGKRLFTKNPGDLPVSVVQGNTQHREGAPCHQVTPKPGVVMPLPTVFDSTRMFKTVKGGVEKTKYNVDYVRTEAARKTKTLPDGVAAYCWKPMCEGHARSKGTCDV